MGNGLTRLANRFVGEPDSVGAAQAVAGQALDAATAEAMGLVTRALDQIDWDDDVRVALEEKAWFIMHTDGVSSPDALPGGSAKTVAAALVEKFGSMSDDAAVLALRWRGSAI